MALSTSLKATLDMATLDTEQRNHLLAMHRMGLDNCLAAYVRTDRLIDQSMKKLALEGLRPEATLLADALRLQDEGLKAAMHSPMNAPRRIHTAVEKLLLNMQAALRATVASALNEATPAIHEHAASDVRAELRGVMDAVREQFELLESAATAAQAEASAADRRVHELERELKKAQFEAEKFRSRVRDQARVPALEAELAAEKAAHAQLRTTTIERDRQTRLREDGLERQISLLTHRTHDLEQQLTALHAELSAAQAQPAPQEPIMSKLSPVQYVPANSLESASLCAYLRAQGIDAHWTAVGVDHGGHCTDAHVEAWRAEYPTPAAMLAQLRAVVRPILNGKQAAA